MDAEVSEKKEGLYPDRCYEFPHPDTQLLLVQYCFPSMGDQVLEQYFQLSGMDRFDFFTQRKSVGSPADSPGFPRAFQ